MYLITKQELKIFSVGNDQCLFHGSVSKVAIATTNKMIT